MQDTSTLEKLQNEVDSIVTGLTHSILLVNLYRECGWVPLHTRPKEQKLAFMYKAVNDLTSEYISDLIPHFVRDVTNYSLRNYNNLRVPFTRTEISRKSCIPSSISLWNSFDEAVCHASKSLRTDCNVPRYCSVQQARIRNKCSNLKHVLYRNHLCNSSPCSCSFIMEDADHFFFNCPNYPNARIALFNATQNCHPLNVKKLLFWKRQPDSPREHYYFYCSPKLY